MAEGSDDGSVTLAEALERVARESKRFATVFRHGTLEVELYAPRGQDPQTPHTRDEAYIIARGSGVFRNGGKIIPFGPGDFLFVPAGVGHRFESFSEDFAAWVLFYGPEGGEAAARSRSST